MKYLYILIFLFMLTKDLSGQSVNICIKQEEGNQNIFLQPKDYFGGIVSEVRFTLRWPKHLGESLDIQYDEFWKDYLSLQPLEEPFIKSDSIYQTFAGFGRQDLVENDKNWNALEDVLLMRIMNMKKLDIADHQELGIQNRDVYVELDGKDYTGTICRIISDVGSHIPQNIHLYPNPFQDILYVTIKRMPTPPAKIHIADILGRSMGEFILLHQTQNQLMIDTSNWPLGTYMATITTERYSWTYKIQKIQ